MAKLNLKTLDQLDMFNHEKQITQIFMANINFHLFFMYTLHFIYILALHFIYILTYSNAEKIRCDTSLAKC